MKKRMSRRGILKFGAAGLLALLAAPVLGMTVGHAEEAGMSESKVLVVYYSRSGNTGEIAGQIRELTGGAVVRLETVQPYPDEYQATTEQARRELDSGFRPALKTTVADLDAYDVVLIGSPNWWGTVATPVMTFLDDHDLSGKAVAVFITHEGSGLGRSVEDLRAFCPKSTIMEGFAVRGRNVAGARDEVAAWLRKLKIIN